jgi:hypothetical protein
MSDVIDPTSTAPVDTGQQAAVVDAGAGEQTPVETSWLDAAPDDLKNNEALKAYKDPIELAKAHLELQSKVEVPPETAEAYDIKVDESLPIDPNFLGWFKQTAHKLGLSQAKAQELAQAYTQLEMAAMREMKIADDKAMDALKIQWGSTYEENKKIAQDGFHKFATEEERTWASSSGLADDPVFIRIFNRIGKAISDDKLIDAGTGAARQMEYSQSGTPMLRYDKTPGMGAPA